MINFDDFTDKRKKVLYEVMNKNWKEFDKYISKTPYKESTSNNSYSFNRDIQEVFHLKDTEQLNNKFEQAVSGSGNEKEKIKRLHSSSLCAFLFFYNVSSDNKLEIELNGNLCEFNDVFFEYKNKVTNKGGPSNIDVVLLGKNCKTGKKAILFLESKFAEYYLYACQSYHMKNAYKNIDSYGKVFDDIKDFQNTTDLIIQAEDDKDTFLLCSDKTCYIEGFKQMFAHFVGVNSFVNGKNPKYYSNRDERSKVIEYKDSDTEVYLGEILYSPEGDSDFKIACNLYGQLYSKFYNLMEKDNFFDSKVRLLKKPLDYREIFLRRTCNTNIGKFYFGI